ncbi:hypothetical protein Q5P01_020221 [Channa striata]|uniref:Uncharacterized protein n=1 Tax=Channa striata TaxID=64152 RepID=A0AA88LXD7_CHASR|nr:hypothetical protein Q5P01_020221 [Channa striata]
MNSEWSGWALGCWNLPPSLCEQDDQRQEGALQMARAINSRVKAHPCHPTGQSGLIDIWVQHLDTSPCPRHHH